MTDVETKVELPDDYAAHLDWYLQLLVNIVNGREIEFPITLFVGGVVISGRLASGHKYFEALGTQLTQFFGGATEETNKLVKHFTAAADIYTNDEPKTDPPQFIHICEARAFSPGQQPIPQEGAWWRGRLAAIDGFHFGSLAFRESDA